MRLFTLFVCALGFLPRLAMGAEADSRLRDALRSATVQLRALEDEKAGWQAKEAQWKAQEAQHQKQLEALRAELAQARRASTKTADERVLKDRLAEQEAAGVRAAAALAQCQKEAQESAGTLATSRKQSDAERAEITGRIDGLNSRVAACEARNARMVTASKDLLRWVAGEGDQLCDPLLRLRRVALENRAQDFEDVLLDH